jgi:hypothetical protein
VHLTSFGLFFFTTVHALTAGSDAGNVAVQWFALGSCTVVGFLTLVRIFSSRPAPRAAGRAGGARVSSRVA